jgi:hypothetical protein
MGAPSAEGEVWREVNKLNIYNFSFSIKIGSGRGFASSIFGHGVKLEPVGCYVTSVRYVEKFFRFSPEGFITMLQISPMGLVKWQVALCYNQNTATRLFSFGF